MKNAIEAAVWAESVFGQAELGDRRRTQRLVKVASLLATAEGASTAKATVSDDAQREGAYRLFRNRDVEPTQIARAGFRAAVARTRGVATVLAVEDTSTLGYKHASARGLGDLGGPANSVARGFHVHSVLLVDFAHGTTLGLAEQRYWMRATAARGQKHRRNERDYRDKESFKWQASAERLRMRLGQEGMRRVVAVCDREADVFEYLNDKVTHDERFVVRACWNRALSDEAEPQRHLWTKLDVAPVLGRVKVPVAQRAGRRARVATLSLRSATVRLRRPSNRKAGRPAYVTVGAVLAREEHAPAGVEPLEWLLITSEAIAQRADVLAVLRMYRLRWRIEEFHKLWKSGAGVERCRMQSADNILRIAVILAFVATRALQLRELFDSDQRGSSCTQLLTDVEWQVLWVTVEKKPLPHVLPTIEWAYHAVGKLGGWYDSKRTGRVGPKTLLDGWRRLEHHLAGYQAALVLSNKTKK